MHIPFTFPGWIHDFNPKDPNGGGILKDMSNEIWSQQVL